MRNTEQANAFVPEQESVEAVVIKQVETLLGKGEQHTYRREKIDQTQLVLMNPYVPLPRGEIPHAEFSNSFNDEDKRVDVLIMLNPCYFATDDPEGRFEDKVVSIYETPIDNPTASEQTFFGTIKGDSVYTEVLDRKKASDKQLQYVACTLSAVQQELMESE